MQNLNIDTGVREFTVNGRGVLRFNPGDPNLYHRFFDAREPLTALDRELSEALAALESTAPDEEARAAAALELLAQYDGKLKAFLNDIFGPANDFNAILEGVNLAAVSTNGQRVVQNLLDALTPILQQGAEDTVQAAAAAAQNEANANRATRRAAASA